jgi:hypothetical protein
MQCHRSIIRALMALPLLAPPLFVSSAYAQKADLAAASASEPRPTSIAIERGRITARIRNHLLGTVLDEISSRTGVSLIASDKIDIEERISAELVDFPLDEGLRRLFTNYDTFFYYGAVRNGSPVRSVWIYPRGTGALLRPIPPDLWAGTGELRASLTDADPEIRARRQLNLPPDDN